MTKVVKVPRGTARKIRRAAGDFIPVNKEASVIEAPDGRYAKSVKKSGK